MTHSDHDRMGPLGAHGECWNLLPWIANESASAKDVARVEAHLRDCHFFCGEHRTRRRAVPPQRLQRAPVGNTDDPGRDQRIAAEVTGLQPHRPERVVDHFFDQVVTRGHPHEEARETTVVDQVQLFESDPIAGRDLAQQFELTCVRLTAAGRTG